jgi:signal transduction histidine kinase
MQAEMRRVTHKHAAVVLAGTVSLYVLIALLTHLGVVSRTGPGIALFGNLVQALLQTVACTVMFMRAREAHGNQRIFWSLLSLGTFIWLLAQLQWIYYENYLGIQPPNPSPGDAIFFLHTVPMIAATALHPHAAVPANEHRLRLGYFDFALLILWWVFLYGYVVIPYQYIQLDDQAFGTRFNLLYAVENITLVCTLGFLWLRSGGAWRRTFKHLFIAAATYTLSSYVINAGIAANRYYTTSLYDIPLITCMAWFCYAAFQAVNEKPSSEAVFSLQAQAYWNSILAAIAVLSMPLLAVWAGVHWTDSPQIQRFRVLLTLGSMMLLMLLLFLKQNLVDRKLIHLLQESRDAYSDLQRLQSHLLQTEKLASIGRLVAGAAHEINNPLTAIVGYSDLLTGEHSLEPHHRELAGKILQQARRTKNLVNNLLTFAKQTPIHRAAVDMNSVSDKALQLHAFDLNRNEIAVKREYEIALPALSADENQLLQVCMHIIGNAVDALTETSGNRCIVIRTEVRGDQVVWSCTDTGPGVSNQGQIFDPFFTTKAVGKGTGLGLSTSYGIIREHNGSIDCENTPGGGARFTISLPIAAVNPPLKDATDASSLRMQ